MPKRSFFLSLILRCLQPIFTDPVEKLTAADAFNRETHFENRAVFLNPIEGFQRIPSRLRSTLGSPASCPLALGIRHRGLVRCVRFFPCSWVVWS